MKNPTHYDYLDFFERHKDLWFSAKEIFHHDEMESVMSMSSVYSAISTLKAKKRLYHKIYNDINLYKFRKANDGTKRP
jgi:hypothetical protein